MWTSQGMGMCVLYLVRMKRHAYTYLANRSSGRNVLRKESVFTALVWYHPKSGNFCFSTGKYEVVFFLLVH